MESASRVVTKPICVIVFNVVFRLIAPAPKVCEICVVLKPIGVVEVPTIADWGCQSRIL